jgi:hypothetical protein
MRAVVSASRPSSRLDAPTFEALDVSHVSSS